MHSLLETALLGPDGSAWINMPRVMPEEYEQWIDAQLYSANASNVYENWKNLVCPLEETKKQPVLDKMWKQIDLVSIAYNVIIAALLMHTRTTSQYPGKR